MWLNKLQIAIIEKNLATINKLVTEIPEFENVDEFESALLLIKEALNLLHHLKDETSITIKRLQQHREFLHSNAIDVTTKLNITS